MPIVFLRMPIKLEVLIRAPNPCSMGLFKIQTPNTGDTESSALQKFRNTVSRQSCRLFMTQYHWRFCDRSHSSQNFTDWLKQMFMLWCLTDCISCGVFKLWWWANRVAVFSISLHLHLKQTKNTDPLHFPDLLNASLVSDLLNFVTDSELCGQFFRMPLV